MGNIVRSYIYLRMEALDQDPSGAVVDSRKIREFFATYLPETFNQDASLVSQYQRALDNR